MTKPIARSFSRDFKLKVLDRIGRWDLDSGARPGRRGMCDRQHGDDRRAVLRALNR